ncbi:MAG: NYN domain-containing protein [Candidatus Binatia bacterium]
MESLLLIDGFNVLHAGVLTGRDRANWWQTPAQRRLVERVERFVDPLYPVIWIVFDRREQRTDEPDAPETVTSADARIRIFYAPSADDWIVAQVEQHTARCQVTVVTADRPLRDRVRRAGGQLLSPSRFLAATS